MSGMDVLRERIAQAIFDSDLDGFPEFAEWGTHRDTYYANADAVIAALRLTEDWDEDCWDGGSIPIRRWTTAWERIEEDA